MFDSIKVPKYNLHVDDTELTLNGDRLVRVDGLHVSQSVIYASILYFNHKFLMPDLIRFDGLHVSQSIIHAYMLYFNHKFLMPEKRIKLAAVRLNVVINGGSDDVII